MKLRIGQKMSTMNAYQRGWFGCRVVFLLEPVIEKEFGIRSLQYIIIWLQLQLCLKQSNSCKFNVAMGTKYDQGSSCVQSYHVILGNLIDLGPSTLQNTQSSIWNPLRYIHLYWIYAYGYFCTNICCIYLALFNSSVVFRLKGLVKVLFIVSMKDRASAVLKMNIYTY